MPYSVFISVSNKFIEVFYLLSNCFFVSPIIFTVSCLISRDSKKKIYLNVLRVWLT